MVMRSVKRGEPSARARAAIGALRARYAQQVTDLDTAANLAGEIAELEEQLGVLAARLQDGGMSAVDVANYIGVHPNRVHRLIDRHHATTDG